MDLLAATPIDPLLFSPFFPVFIGFLVLKINNLLDEKLQQVIFFIYGEMVVNILKDLKICRLSWS